MSSETTSFLPNCFGGICPGESEAQSEAQHGVKSKKCKSCNKLREKVATLHQNNQNLTGVIQTKDEKCNTYELKIQELSNTIAHLTSELEKKQKIGYQDQGNEMQHENEIQLDVSQSIEMTGMDVVSTLKQGKLMVEQQLALLKQEHKKLEEKFTAQQPQAPQFSLVRESFDQFQDDQKSDSKQKVVPTRSLPTIVSDYISQLDHDQLHYYWIMTTTDVNWSQVSTINVADKFLLQLLTNIVNSVTSSVDVSETVIQYTIKTLSQAFTKGYENALRNQHELFLYKDSNQFQLVEFLKYFKSMILDPSLDLDFLYRYSFVAPSFIPYSFTNVNINPLLTQPIIDKNYSSIRNDPKLTIVRPLTEQMIDNNVNRILMAMQSKLHAAQKVISILLDFNSRQRSIIIRNYNSMFKQQEQQEANQKGNEKKIDDEENYFETHFSQLKMEKASKKLLALLQYSQQELDTYYLNFGIQRVKIDIIYEILATRTNSQLRACLTEKIKQGIMFKYLKNVKFKFMLQRILRCEREEYPHINEKQCFLDAQVIYNSFYKNLDSSASEAEAKISKYLIVYKIFSDRSYLHLRRINEIYLSLGPISLRGDLEICLKKEKDSQLARNFVSVLLQVACNRLDFFSQLLVDSMKGVGMNNTMLNRVVLTRCEYDLAQISYNFCVKEEFSKKKTLLNWLLDEDGITNSPIYQQLILRLFGLDANSQASQYTTSHLQLTPFNPCSYGAMFGGGKPMDKFNCSNELDHSLRLIDAVDAQNFATDKNVTILFENLAAMSMAQRYEMNQLHFTNNHEQQVLENVVDGVHFPSEFIRIASVKKDGKQWQAVLDILRGFFEPLSVFDAFWMNKFVVAKDFENIAMVICCRGNLQLRELVKVYQLMFGKSLLSAIQEVCQKANKSTVPILVQNLLTFQRHDDSIEGLVIDYAKVRFDCASIMRLQSAGRKKSKAEFVRVLTTRTWKHIRCVVDCFNRDSNGATFDELLKKIGGESAKMLSCLLGYSLDPVRFYAEYIITKKSAGKFPFQNIGRVLVAREQIDMQAIVTQFTRHPGTPEQSLLAWIHKKSNYPAVVKVMFVAVLESQNNYFKRKFNMI